MVGDSHEIALEADVMAATRPELTTHIWKSVAGQIVR